MCSFGFIDNIPQWRVSKNWGKKSMISQLTIESEFSTFLGRHVIQFRNAPFTMVILWMISRVYYFEDHYSIMNETFVLDQEEVVKELITNNSEVLDTKINGRLPIHFAAKHSTKQLRKIQNFPLNWIFDICSCCRQREHSENYYWFKTWYDWCKK